MNGGDILICSTVDPEKAIGAFGLSFSNDEYEDAFTLVDFLEILECAGVLPGERLPIIGMRGKYISAYTAMRCLERYPHMTEEMIVGFTSEQRDIFEEYLQNLADWDPALALRIATLAHRSHILNTTFH